MVESLGWETGCTSWVAAMRLSRMASPDWHRIGWTESYRKTTDVIGSIELVEDVRGPRTVLCVVIRSQTNLLDALRIRASFLD